MAWKGFPITTNAKDYGRWVEVLDLSKIQLYYYSDYTQVTFDKPALLVRVSIDPTGTAEGIKIPDQDGNKRVVTGLAMGFLKLPKGRQATIKGGWFVIFEE